MGQIDQANALIQNLANRMGNGSILDKKEPVYVGVDIGTANVVSIAIDSAGMPLTGEITPAHVVKEGMVVDYFGALRIVKKQISTLRERLGVDLKKAASAIPPGTETGNIKVTQNILEDAGLDVAGIIDEPTAAALVLGIEKGVVVDVGGGTTGISILENGKVIYSADEPTGGFHFDLVIAGHFGISIEEAEAIKRDPVQQIMLFRVIQPVVEKIAYIISRHVAGYQVEDLYLVGGTCSFPGMAQHIEKETGIKAYLPAEPLLITPLGIALASRLY